MIVPQREGRLSSGEALTIRRGCLYTLPSFGIVLSSSGVGVAQLVEHWIVAPVVVGSIPIAHLIFQ